MNMEPTRLILVLSLILTPLMSTINSAVSNTRHQTLEQGYKRIKRAVVGSSKDSDLLRGFQFFDQIANDIKAGAVNGEDLTRVRREEGVSEIIKNCCKTIREYLDKKSNAKEVLCSESDLEQCCKDFGDEIDKQQKACDVLCPNNTTETPTTKAPVVIPPLPSCKEILQKYPDAGNGTYKILGKDGKTFDAYCQMTSLPGCPGGGYTMVMKIKGDSTQFIYQSRFWTSMKTSSPENGATGFDDKATKLPAFWENYFDDLCVGIKVGDTTRFLSMKAPAGKGPNKEGAWSLYDVLSNDDYHQSKLGEAKWRSLVPAASLQPNCKKEGFNVKSKRMKVRIGILGNNEDDCLSAESFIGVGGNPWHNELCGFKVDKVITVGNIATCGPDNGVKVTRGMGYILIR